jgi:hypothetical protein
VVGKIYKQGIKNKWGGDGSEQPPFEGFRLYIVLYPIDLESILQRLLHFIPRFVSWNDHRVVLKDISTHCIGYFM